MRLSRPLAALLCCAALLLAACGSDDDASAGGGAGSGADTTTVTTKAEATFPQTVTHKFGETTVAEKPERIVVVGLTEQDVVLQLGYRPVATTEWYGDQPDAVWPWAHDLLGDAKPTVLTNADGFDLEKIAAQRPDLIIGVNAGMKAKDYAQLSKLAPTIGSPVGATDYFSPWDQQVELVARALGKPEEGARLVQEVKDSYAKVAAEHPEFQGKTATFSQNAFYDGLLYVYPPTLGTDFLDYLTFTPNPKLTPLYKSKGEQVAISAERLDVIDADVIVVAAEAAKDVAALEKVPTYRALDAVKGKRVVYTDPILSGALYFQTPLAFRYVLERLPDALDQALAGRSPTTLVGGP